MRTTTDTARCADCGRRPHDGVVLRELRLLTDPVNTPQKYLCAGGPDGAVVEGCLDQPLRHQNTAGEVVGDDFFRRPTRSEFLSSSD